MKTEKIRLGGKCPKCDKAFFFDEKELPKSFTTDCDCGETLLIEDGVIYPFHEKMHQEDPRWPADGKNTGTIKI